MKVTEWFLTVFKSLKKMYLFKKWNPNNKLIIISSQTEPQSETHRNGKNAPNNRIKIDDFFVLIEIRLNVLNAVIVQSKLIKIYIHVLFTLFKKIN